jgi:hypothetical protein
MKQLALDWRPRAAYAGQFRGRSERGAMQSLRISMGGRRALLLLWGTGLRTQPPVEKHGPPSDAGQARLCPAATAPAARAAGEAECVALDDVEDRSRGQVGAFHLYSIARAQGRADRSRRRAVQLALRRIWHAPRLGPGLP